MTTVPDPYYFQHPAIRHLAWMLTAPQLLEDVLTFCPSEYVTDNVWPRLCAWDQSPENGPAVLTAPAHPRLGLYFEALYECLLRDLLEWRVLVRNLPVRGSQRTLGELDCVVLNPHTGALEHHEVAVKFYLGYSEADAIRWYGPNARDRLDLKTRRLLEHQSQLTGLPETRAALQAAGISGVLQPRIFMPGYLFYPRDIGSHQPLRAPARVPANHARGRWCRLEEAVLLSTEYWVPLNKPHWLGPWQQLEAPDPMHSAAALELARLRDGPQLFAALEWDSGAGLWREAERWFVVPESWPRIAMRGA